MPARTRMILSLCTVIFVTVAHRASAQAVDASGVASMQLWSASTPVSTTAPAPQAGPTMQSLRVGLQPQSSASTETMAAAAQRRGAGFGQGEALMIVGGAAILVGAVVGGDGGQIIMIGGAVIGLVGLYKFLQ
jgi:hypothetical protein